MALYNEIALNTLGGGSNSKNIGTSNHPIVMVDNYIYLQHLNEFIVIPQYPEQIADTVQTQFNQADILSSSAPIFSYAHSGPRSFQVELHLHRDLMRDVNYGVSNVKLSLSDDYIDILVRHLQAAVLPRYAASEKMVDPPIVMVRFGNEIFCKGIINGSLTTTYSGPIMADEKYACVDIAFNITEIDPYDAQSIQSTGSFRGISTTLESNLWKSANKSRLSSSVSSLTSGNITY